jgi:hypothetical protein
VRETEPWLRDNQRDAIAAAVAAMEGQGYGLLKHRRGLMLADDVGMGKTWEAIGAVAIYWARHPRAGQPVFLVPPALREKWVAEVREFTERALKLTPPGRFRNAVARIGRRFGDELVVTTSRVGELSRSRLARTLGVLVLDEAHRARNPRSKLSEHLHRIITRSRRRHGPRILFLTATPFQCDHHRELIHLLSFLDGAYRNDWAPISEDCASVMRRLPTAPSIVNALKETLVRIDGELKAIERARPSEAPARLNQILELLDWNHDAFRDPNRRSGGVVSPMSDPRRIHDGVDEYLRALVVRTVKGQVSPSPKWVGVHPVDAAAYLFGRARLRQL